MQAYHFTADTLRDGTPIPATNTWLEFPDEPILCEQGLHASLDPWDALQYAPGPNLHLVELGGTIIHGDDKLVATRRKILKSIDATDLLRRFAADQALSVIHLWDAPEIVKDYLTTLNPAKRSAALSAARSAAQYTAKSAAQYAARSAAKSAARSTFNKLVKDKFK